MMGRVLGGVRHLYDHLHEVPVHVIPCVEGRTDGKGAFAQASRWGSIMPGGLELHARRAFARARDGLDVRSTSRRGASHRRRACPLAEPTVGGDEPVGPPGAPGSSRRARSGRPRFPARAHDLHEQARVGRGRLPSKTTSAGDPVASAHARTSSTSSSLPMFGQVDRRTFSASTSVTGSTSCPAAADARSARARRAGGSGRRHRTAGAPRRGAAGRGRRRESPPRRTAGRRGRSRPGARIAEPPRPSGSRPAISSRSGKSSGYEEPRWKWHGLITNDRDSRAMWTSVACQASPSSAVEAM